MSISQQKYRIVHDLMLHEAASIGDDLKLFLNISYVKRGRFDINFKDGDFGDRTPLHCSAGEGHVRCCKHLLEGGADSSSRMTMGWTPAHCAAEGGHIAVLRLLADSGGNLNSRDDYGDTPKVIAERYGHTECVKYIDSVGETPEQRKASLRSRFDFMVQKAVMEVREKSEDET